ncbi:MAG: hypothetical protein ACF8NJ_09510 [Phycisphaerales bacterium JB038]
MKAWRRVIRGWLARWIGVSLLLGAVTTYAVAFALPQVTPVERYQLRSDETAQAAAWGAGFFCARFEAFGVRRIALDQYLGERPPASTGAQSAYVRRTPHVQGIAKRAELQVRPTRVGAWTSVSTVGAARPDLCYCIASGWPFAALRGRIEYQLSQPNTARVQWFAGGVGQPTKVEGAMVTAPPTPLRLNLGPAIVPLRPVWFGFAGNTALAGLIWLSLFGGVKFGRHRLRLWRGRCPDCGYDLHRCDVPGCPECGWQRGTETPDRGETRRRVGRAASGRTPPAQ